MRRVLRFVWSRQFWIGFAAVNCWYDAVLVCGGASPNWLFLGLFPVLMWSVLHLLEARWRERESHAERAHLIGQCMRLECERNLLLRRNRQLLGLESRTDS